MIFWRCLGSGEVSSVLAAGWHNFTAQTG